MEHEQGPMAIIYRPLRKSLFSNDLNLDFLPLESVLYRSKVIRAKFGHADITLSRASPGAKKKSYFILVFRILFEIYSACQKNFYKSLFMENYVLYKKCFYTISVIFCSMRLYGVPRL